ncbi:class I SAM-dependent methyltransferase [Ferroacidibacillus organovorans]|uniref:Methyltransferase type 11 domain-containing protein n=1 Tax=Ferroacidibacillus organovorans TaxID=1765683 RepID=A0A853KBV6_9BACL|nr:class I SAM-dependent methyltransferase [Ferroacidibacillus organovorans]KYP79778.1 hypothetical protein AYJ22_13630 [Ferroacidibacillus organovorans]OAG93619.1 hypothetical protein AYW79_09695 [Ferroacidibacillus organovorans]
MCVNHPRFTRFYVWGQRYVEQAVGEIREKQNSKAYGRTLIVGAGTGLDISTLGSKVSEITLLEPDAHMRTYLKQTYDSLPLIPSTAENMDVGDGQFDTVITSLVLCSVTNVRQVLSEIYRVLKPGGQYLFMEHVQHNEAVSRMVQNSLNPVWQHIAGGCQLNRKIADDINASAFTTIECSLVKPHFLIPIIAGQAIRI